MLEALSEFVSLYKLILTLPWECNYHRGPRSRLAAIRKASRLSLHGSLSENYHLKSVKKPGTLGVNPFRGLSRMLRSDLSRAHGFRLQAGSSPGIGIGHILKIL